LLDACRQRSGLGNALDRSALSAKTLRDRLAFDRALDNAPAALLGFGQRRNLASARLDIFGFGDRPGRNGRRALHQLALGIGAVDRIVGHHRLRDANRTALLGDLNRAARHQSDTCGGGG
jgi:hypothetical protein